jgi:DNA-3-methyladenine glycosylase I
MSESTFLLRGQDGKLRCAWCGTDPLYQKYHDEEWGRIVTDDQVLFEFLILESFQAGLSWLTILRKRENFRKAFKDFNAQQVARMGKEDLERLMQDSGIVRNRLKIEAAINNASRFLEIQSEFGSFGNYLDAICGKDRVLNEPVFRQDLPASSKLSDLLSRDMGKRGFKFRGSTICYAFLQAVGRVDDHICGCWVKTAK